MYSCNQCEFKATTDAGPITYQNSRVKDTIVINAKKSGAGASKRLASSPALD